MNNVDLIINSIGFPLFWVKLVLGFVFSFLITFYAIPTIVKISRRKNLMDEPGARSSHIRKIPNLGGIAIFFSIGVSAPVFAYELFDLYKFLFASLVILLYIGIMDDIMIMRAYKKLIAQVLVSSLVVLGSDVRIGSLFGLFGVYEIGYFVSVVLSIVIFVALINAFNLIDGIDGLAGTFTLVSCSVFGFTYYRLGEENYPLVILCAIMIGTVLAFLYYNLSNYRIRKIFMGDTGSMILGFLLAFTAISFVNIFVDRESSLQRYHLDSAPAIAIAILILPIIDTMNVMILRLLNGESLFEADKKHIHHSLLRLGFTHRRSTFYIIVYYLTLLLMVYFLRHLEVNLLLLIVLLMGFLGAYIPIIRHRMIKK